MYVKKSQRGAGGGGGGQTTTYGQEAAPSWGGGGGAAPSGGLAPPPRQDRSSLARSVIQLPTAVVLYDYQSQASDELNLKEGDVVEIVTKDASGWWTGRLKGKQGLFPGFFLSCPLVSFCFV